MTTTHVRRTFAKGHGTENDFVLLPDLDGTHDVTAEQVRHLADRRAGVGGDGVIRVVPTSRADEPAVRAQAGHAAWFMDYRNADGSVAEMCGNGTRVFAAYLRREGLEVGDVVRIATRTGVKTVRFESEDLIAVDLGHWSYTDGSATVGIGGWPQPVAGDGTPPDAAAAVATSPTATSPTAMSPTATSPIAMSPTATLLDLGNPHTVVRLAEGGDLAALDLGVPPHVDPVPAQGTNVEVVQVLRAGHLRMRVHERGVGETRSCGTGAAAAALAARRWTADQQAGGRPVDVWRVDVPGGTLRVTALPGSRVELAGPARLVADGVVHL